MLRTLVLFGLFVVFTSSQDPVLLGGGRRRRLLEPPILGSGRRRLGKDNLGNPNEEPVIYRPKIDQGWGVDNCTCSLGLYAGQNCKPNIPIKSFGITVEEVCEDLDIFSFRITDCETDKLVVDFYSGGSCDTSKEKIEKTLVTGVCEVVPHVSEFSVKVTC